MSISFVAVTDVRNRWEGSGQAPQRLMEYLQRRGVLDEETPPPAPEFLWIHEIDTEDAVQCHQWRDKIRPSEYARLMLECRAYHEQIAPGQRPMRGELGASAVDLYLLRLTIPERRYAGQPGKVVASKLRDVHPGWIWEPEECAIIAATLLTPLLDDPDDRAFREAHPSICAATAHFFETCAQAGGCFVNSPV